MSDWLLLSLSAAVIFLLLVMLWLWRGLHRLQSRFDELEQAVNRNNEDIAGLCSAAVTVDSRIVGTDQQLKSIIEKLAQYRQSEAPAQDASTSNNYRNVIEKIHEGADAEELVRDYGLSREEAILLIRLNAAR